MNWCVVIPTFNNGKTLAKVIEDVLQTTRNVIVVNDGSTDNTLEVLKGFPQITCIHNSKNKGKGYSLRKGFDKALKDGFDYAVTLDSDGQHFASDITTLTNKCHENPDSLIVGSRSLEGEKLRKGSGFANKFSNFWFKLIAGVSLPDTQSGFRMYPLQLLGPVKFYCNRYEFELEVLYRAAWKGINLVNVPIKVFYPEKSERVSHFRPFHDFVRISLLNVVCFFIAFFYVKPFSFAKYLRKENLKDFIRDNIIHTNDSAWKMTFSVMLGVFMGIIPIWGYQLISAIALAYLFRLNKLLVIVAANISIFPFTAVILYLSYITGGLVMPESHLMGFSMDISIDSLGSGLYQYLVGAVILAVVASLFFGLLTYIFLKLIRKKPSIAS